MKRRARRIPCLRIIDLFDRFAALMPPEAARYRNCFVNFGLRVWASAKREGRVRR